MHACSPTVAPLKPSPLGKVLACWSIQVSKLVSLTVALDMCVTHLM